MSTMLRKKGSVARLHEVDEMTLVMEMPGFGPDGWDELMRDVAGGERAFSPLMAALDRPVEPLLNELDAWDRLVLDSV